ncbi:MAG TPA: alpha/beta hydrolase [Acidimicrobiia bacterium]|nr:alpha/beta hydrolase [Acidimicrobiia bacterium]
MSSTSSRLRSDRSTRLDRNTGVEERVRFVGPGGQYVFAVSYTPLAGESRGGVIVSPSLLADRVRTYRAEVELARRLAADGFSVVRYDYRGFGHSDGVTGEATIESMVADLESVHREILSPIADMPLVQVGVRFGSVIAAAGAEKLGGDVVLWDPALNARSYLRESFRAHMIGRINHETSAETPLRQLEEKGEADVLGYTVSQQLVSSASSAPDVSTSVSSEPRRVLWVSFGDPLRQKEIDLVEGWRANGLDVETEVVDLDDLTWYIGARPIVGDEVVTRTARWLEGS